VTLVGWLSCLHKRTDAKLFLLVYTLTALYFRYLH
jgi:hypothetical protein